MSAMHTSGGVPVSTDRRQPGGRLARWLVALAALSAIVLAASSATIAVAYAVGSESTVEDNWLGALLAAVASIGLLGALVAFVGAIVAGVRGERWVLLWLPLALFPACLLFLVLGEAFWWE